MNTEKENMITRMEVARKQLNAALEKVAPQVEIYPTWKLKQVLDHITGWDDLTLSALRDYSKGETSPITIKHGIDQYNDESVGNRKALSLEQSRQAYDLARERVLHALREIHPEMLIQRFTAPWGGMCTIASVVKIFVSHEMEHAKQIEEILDRFTPGH